MKIGAWLAAAATLTLATTFTLDTAASAQEIKISHQWRQNSDGRDLATRVFVKEVNAKDPGIKFRIYPNRSLVSNPTSQIDGLQDGTLEMAVYPLVYAAGKVPEFSITVMPGTVGNLGQAMKIKNTPFYDKLQEICAANGIRVITWWWTPGGFATKDREIKGPESVKGLRMRAADPYFELMLKDLGASVQSMPSTDVYPALQSGVLDGLLTSSESFVSMKIFEQTKHATAGGDYTLFMLLQPLVMSKQHWDKLTPAQQKIFDEAAAKSELFFNGLQEDATQKMVDTFKKNGNDVRAMTKAEYDAWVEVARTKAWPAFAENTKQGKELLDLLNAALKK